MKLKENLDLLTYWRDCTIWIYKSKI